MFLLPEVYWEIKKTKNKGRGVFANKPIRQGVVIGDYVGKVVQLKDVDFEKEKKNLYLMYYDDETGIYPDLKKPGIYLLNHSCSPNCWITKFRNHTIVFALKNIRKGSELTISYLLPPKMTCNPCSHNCLCKSDSCTGSMHLTEDGYNTWQKFQNELHRGRAAKYLSDSSTYARSSSRQSRQGILKQNKGGKKDIPETQGIGSELKPLKNYPKVISKKLIREIKMLQTKLYR